MDFHLQILIPLLGIKMTVIKIKLFLDTHISGANLFHVKILSRLY
jgi:hypothetical protein